MSDHVWLQKLIDAASYPNSANAGLVELQSRAYEIGAPIILRPSVKIKGVGGAGANQPATLFVPASGYTGSCFVGTDTDTVFWHAGWLTGMRIKGFGGHGIDLQCPMGELALIDDVCVQNCGSDGIKIGPGLGTPVMLGRINVSGNIGAGLRIYGQNSTHVQVQYLAGDDNGESLCTIEGGNHTASHHIIGWKSERSSASPGPGHPRVLLCKNLNGGIVDFGQGRVLVGSGIADSENAIIEQIADEGQNPGYVRFLFTANAEETDYAAAYRDLARDYEISLSDGPRYAYSTIPRWPDPRGGWGDFVERYGENQIIMGDPS